MKDSLADDLSSCHGAAHQQCVAEALESAERICRERGLRLTRLRRRVLELVWANHRPVGAYEILEMLQQRGKAGPPTVYRALEFFQDLGLVHRLASLNAFVGCSHPDQPHAAQFLICRQCRNLRELHDPDLAAGIAAVARRIDFQPGEQFVEVMGLCADCRKKGESG